MDTDELRKCAKAVFLATDEDVAKNISIMLSTAASEIDMLRASLAVAKKDLCTCNQKEISSRFLCPVHNK